MATGLTEDFYYKGYSTREEGQLFSWERYFQEMRAQYPGAGEELDISSERRIKGPGTLAPIKVRRID
jgi:hypothetical protein